MNAQEIDAMEAGREMDRLITVRVFGAVVEGNLASIDPDAKDTWVEIPYHSEFIHAAWTVIECLDGCFHLQEHGEHGDWEAEFCSFPGSVSHADTAPLAICRAALKAVLASQPAQQAAGV